MNGKKLLVGGVVLVLSVTGLVACSSKSAEAPVFSEAKIVGIDEKPLSGKRPVKVEGGKDKHDKWTKIAMDEKAKKRDKYSRSHTLFSYSDDQLQGSQVSDKFSEDFAKVGGKVSINFACQTVEDDVIIKVAATTDNKTLTLREFRCGNGKLNEGSFEYDASPGNGVIVYSNGLPKEGYTLVGVTKP